MVLAMLATTTAWAEHELSDDELRFEMARNKALATYVARNGMPDLAETRFLADVGPWDEHEVTVYYLDRRKELGFARAFLLGRPEVQIERYQRILTDQEASALAERSRRWKGRLSAAQQERMARNPDGEGGMARANAEGEGDMMAGAKGGRDLAPDERAENAAARAEAAASRIESAALTTERAAERTEAIVAKMETAQAARPRRRKATQARASAPVERKSADAQPQPAEAPAGGG
jgi:hypothetical protein